MAMLARVVYKGLNTNQGLPRPVYSYNPFSQLSRPFSNLHGKNVCQCGASIPTMERIGNLFKERSLRQLTQEIKCHYFRSFQFKITNDCKLVDEIEKIATTLLHEFKDVVLIGNARVVFLESLLEIPEGDLGDLTGDHGKQLAKFFKDGLDQRLITDVGAVFDIGGQNTSTVNLISTLLNNQNLPCMIVDINSLAPAISKPQPNVKYAIEDAFTFFSSDSFQELVKGTLNEKPAVFIFNNMLNALKADAGWKTLEATWKRLRDGDYLIISGLVPEQLEQHGFKRHHEVDGIIEFHHKSKGFYKSALSANFFEYVVRRLISSSILLQETFTFSIETRPANTVDVKGRRLLTLKKIK